MSNTNDSVQGPSSPFFPPFSLDKVAVLVPAAGEGVRMGGERKQFRRLGGAPMLVQTLRAFVQHPDVDHLIVAVPAKAIEGVEEMLQAVELKERTAVVSGGETRQASVAAALDAVPEAAGLVLVHDAVRPFVTPELITAVIEAVRAHGAAAPAIPVTDTLRRVATREKRGSARGASTPEVRRSVGGYFGETVPRRNLYRMQTPQGFRRGWLEAAHAEAARAGQHATDDVSLVQHLSHPVHLVEGSTYNFKITTPEDWERAQALWEKEFQV